MKLINNYKLLFVVLTAVLVFVPGEVKGVKNPKVHYTFANSGNDKVTDVSGNGYHGTLQNDAVFTGMDTLPVLKLGAGNGFVDMGSHLGELISTLEDFTIATYIFVDVSENLTTDGNFIWSFANSTDILNDRNGNMFFSARDQRYAISGTYYNAESGVGIGETLQKGCWKHIAYVQQGNTGIVYLDGQQAAAGNVTLQPQRLGKTPYNFIGRSPYAADSYLTNSFYSDFRIYDTFLSDDEILSLAGDLDKLNLACIYQEIAEFLGNISAVRTHLQFPTQTAAGVPVNWISSDETYITSSGRVNRPENGSEAVEITLTATIDYNGLTGQRDFVVTVLPLLNDSDAVASDLEDIQLYSSCIYGDIHLPSEGIEGSVISWHSDNPGYLSDTGKLIKLPENGTDNLSVILTATISRGEVSEEKDFYICIYEDEGFSAYLFAYFTGNNPSEEHIYFALSDDGYNYRALNDNKPVISADTISNKKGVRDPHILRGEDGNFYMVVTDMRSSEGWTSNHGIVLLKSQDLLTWTHSAIDIKAVFSKFANIDRAWAPQVIYDHIEEKYMVYWSMKYVNGDKDIIYYSYANEDFTGLLTEPEILFDYPTATIDGDIIYKDGKYYLFFKTEGSGNGIRKAVSDRVNGGYIVEDDTYLQQTSNPVEGSCVFKLINSDIYIFMYDVYASGRYEFTETTDFENFTVVPHTMDFRPRHGTVIPITSEEAGQLRNHDWTYSTNLKRVNKSVGGYAYPNPVREILTLILPENDRFTEIIISDLTGKTFVKQVLPAGTNQLDCSVLPVGFYILSFTQNQQEYKMKISRQ